GATRNVIPLARDGAKNTAGTCGETCERYTDSSHDGARWIEKRLSCATMDAAPTSPSRTKASLRSPSMRGAEEDWSGDGKTPEMERVAGGRSPRRERLGRPRPRPEVEDVAEVVR